MHESIGLQLIAGSGGAQQEKYTVVTDRGLVEVTAPALVREWAE